MPIVAAYAVPHPPLIVPSVGRGREREIADTIAAYEEVARRIAAHAPDTIVIASPHATMYADYFHISPGVRAYGDFGQFGAASTEFMVEYDQPLVDQICALADRDGLAAGTLGLRMRELDHGTMVPLYFVQRACDEAGVHPQYVRIGLSGLPTSDHYKLGMLIAEAARDLGRRVVMLASGDLAHKLKDDGPYGFAPEAPEFDEQICEVFASGDFLALLEFDRGFCERAAECGLRSFQIMAGALDRTAITPELLSHEGTFGVGYGIACFELAGEEGACESRAFLPAYEAWRQRDLADRKAHEDAYVRLARASLEAWVSERRAVTPADVDGLPAELLDRRAGCFVSLKKDGNLRGCIGTIAPTQASLAAEICENARSASTRDPRFDAVGPDELADLVYDVDVLGEPESIASEAELDPKRYGVIVSDAYGRRGLLLPDLDGVDTAEEQVRIAARKGGIDLFDRGVRLQRFEVVRHV